MADRIRKLTSEDGAEVMYYFHCPGCGFGHPFHVQSKIHCVWDWNGSLERPTFRPSLGVFMTEPSMRCHSFVTDGKIEFLGDSFHHLKGQTLEMLDEED